MHLVGIQNQVPDGSVAGDARDYCSIVRGSFRQEIPLRAGIPSLAGIPTPEDATVALTSEAFTLQLASIPEDVTNLKLVILASDPQGNGITRAYSKAAAFDAPVTPVATPIDLKAKYDAKYGAPSAGNPKVFIKYFFVNAATGEKSGEKMASAVLSNG